MTKPRDVERKRRLLVLRQQQLPTAASPAGRHGTVATLDDDEFFGLGVAGGIALSVENTRTGKTEEHVLRQPFALIGRSAECDIQLADREVSFRHAYVQLVGGRLLCVDLASRTGLRWESGRARTGWVQEGEPLVIGPFLISRLAESEDRQEQARSPVVDSGAFFSESRAEQSIGTLTDFDVTLEYLDHDGSRDWDRPYRWSLRRPITLVGSSRHCKLRLTHESVSRVHCSLILAPSGLWVADLLGRGGTKVDGRPVKFFRLDHGSRLQVGHFQFRVRYGSAAGRVGESDGAGSRRQDFDRRHEDDTGTPRPKRTGPPSESGGFSESFVLSLVNQFAAMQQEMFAQSQQQMLLLTQVFGSLHQNQQDVIRDDLVRIHEITREMQQLQGDLLKRRTVAELGLEDRHGTHGPRTDRQLPASHDPSSSRENGPAQGTERQGLEEDTSPASRSRDPAGSNPEADASGSPGEADACESPSDAGDEPSQPGTVEPVASDDADEARQPADEDHPRRNQSDIESHAWLNERMAALEKEKNSRWKRIMSVLGGSPG